MKTTDVDGEHDRKYSMVMVSSKTIESVYGLEPFKLTMASSNSLKSAMCLALCGSILQGPMANHG